MVTSDCCDAFKDHLILFSRVLLMKVCFKAQAAEKTLLFYLPCCVIWLDEIFNFNKNPVFNTHTHTYTLYI